MRLRLNPTKTELIWFHWNNHTAHPINNQCLQLDPNCIITPVNTVRDLGVLLDSSLNMKAHITSVTRVMLLSPSPYTTSQEMFERTLPASFGSSSRYIEDWLLQLNSRRSACSNNSPVDHRSPCRCSDCKKHPSSRSHHTRYAKSTLASHPGTSNVQTLFAHVQYLLASRSHLYVLIDQRALKSSRKSWTSINISWRCGDS